VQAFIQPTRAHLTLVMLKLFTERDRQAANRALNDCAPILATAPREVVLSGLDILNDDPSGASISLPPNLHALTMSVQLPGLSMYGHSARACKRLWITLLPCLPDMGLPRTRGEDCVTSRAGSADTGWYDAFHRVKIHATIVNVRYASRDEEKNSPPLDARPLLAAFAQHHFGTCALKELQINSLCVTATPISPMLTRDDDVGAARLPASTTSALLAYRGPECACSHALYDATNARRLGAQTET
jgi:hypothetical protein